jgi:WbqC-like protein family
MTTVVISQPMLFPWSGFFELIACADIFVHLDDAQFSKGSFTNRVQLKRENGIGWMTVPLSGKGTFQKINQLEPLGVDWRKQHRELVRQSLEGSANLQSALWLFDLAYKEESLVDLLIKSVESSSLLVNSTRPKSWLKSSSMQISGASWQRVLSMVKALGGNRYVTAHGAANYLNHEEFERQGVQVEYVEYSKTEYPQLNGAFVPYVSIIDAVANLGEKAKEIINPRTVSWVEFVERN